MITRNILTSGLLCLSSISSFGWGQKGHDTTAFIAECHLTPTTLDKVMDLLDGKSPVYYAIGLIMLLIHRNMHILKRGIIKILMQIKLLIVLLFMKMEILSEQYTCK